MTQKIIFYSKNTNCYSDKVLIGDWVQVRKKKEEQPKPQKYNVLSTYKETYTPKPSTKWDTSTVWDHLIKAEDTHIWSDVGRYGSGNYFDNYSSLSDLSYNHFPKCYEGVFPRKWHILKGSYEPRDEYLPSFGNITKYGLLEYKKTEWDCDRNSLTSSSYRFDFKAPNLENYKFRRYVSIPPKQCVMANVVQRGKKLL